MTTKQATVLEPRPRGEQPQPAPPEPTPQKIRTVFTEGVVMDIGEVAGFTSDGMVLKGGTLIPLDPNTLTNILYVWQVSRGSRPDQPIIGFVDDRFMTLVSIPVDDAPPTPMEGAPSTGVIEVEATPIA